MPHQRVLLCAEQGLGDSIQFLRYVPMAAERAKSVVLQLPAALHGLARDAFGDRFQVVEEGNAVRADLQCPLASLPLAFGTHEETIPCAVPYLRSDAARAEEWRLRLDGPRDTRLRVGLVCSGNPAHQNDINRSIALEQFRASMPRSCDFVLLQPSVRDSDRQALRDWPTLRTFTRELTDFRETAALIEALDVVVAVDTSVAHLAGALGRPVWILLPYCPDWRWMLERIDSPWYPSARLYRQDRPRDWASVLERVAKDLAALGAPAG